MSDEQLPDPEKFPTFDNCDPDDPKEAMWWTFPSLPGMRGALALVPIEYYQLVSAHQYECGVRVVCDNCGHRTPPSKKLRLPDGDPSMWTGQGMWVPIDTPEPDLSPLQKAVDGLSQAEQAQLFRVLDQRNTGAQQ